MKRHDDDSLWVDFWFGVCVIALVVGSYGGAALGISIWLSHHVEHLNMMP